MTINHNGFCATLEWREENDGWKQGWWVTLTGTALPIGDGEAEEVAALVREKYIGDPPPEYHSMIWGGYTWGSCGDSGVRLWREYNTFLDRQTLRCRTCCERHEGKEKRAGSDQIGWSVPAVPTPDGSTFWGYTSVPLVAVQWWKALPESRM